MIARRAAALALPLAVVSLSGAFARAAAADVPSWASETASPSPFGEAELSDLERRVQDRCGPGERGLRETAVRIVAVKLGGGAMPELGAIAFAQRRAGEPHPWARAWAARGRDVGGVATMRELDAWLAADEAELRRCGVASGVARDGQRVVVAVSVDALADLAPLPTRARVGQWLTVEARMRVPLRGGHVIVLGPSGVPQSLITSLDGNRLRARFAPDGPGEFAVQVTADVASGPRPVLEASVFVDVDPPPAPREEPAPGEDEQASAPARDDAGALATMLSAARASARLPALARDSRLDAIARAHALAMARTGQLAHDAGDGSPTERLHAAGLQPGDAGENVAHATSVALAHRAMWTSPTHRAEMLAREFDRVGLGVARDAHGDAWVVELFAPDSL